MTTKITLYQYGPFKDQNYKFNNKTKFKNYLDSNNTELIKTDFQFVRIEKEMSIKVNLSQVYTLNVAYNTYKYMAVEETGNTDSKKIYFFFINDIQQISPMCIELDIEMDVLNTFDFKIAKSDTLSYNGFEIDDRTLLSRLHRNRLSTKSKSYSYLKTLSNEEQYYRWYLFADGEGFSFTKNIKWNINWKAIQDLYNNNIITTDGGIKFTGYYKLESDPGTKLPYFEIYNGDSGNLLGSYETITFYPTHLTGTDFEGNNDFYDWINYPSLLIKIPYDMDDEIYESTYSEMCESIEALEQFLQYVITQKQVTEYFDYRRIIDEYPENINPFLFKVSENKITFEDEDNTWYLIYANQNNPANPGDTEAHYINPVEVLFSADYSYIVTSSGNRPIELLATDPLLPKISNWAEIMAIRYKDMNNTGYIKIGGVTYSLDEPTTSTTANYNAIVLLRENNTDTKFKVYGWKVTTDYSGASSTYIGEFSGVEISGVNIAHWDKFINPSIYLTNPSYTSYLDYDNYKAIYLNSGTSTDTGTTTAFFNLDRTDPKLIKIINLPYAPLKELEHISDTALPYYLVYNSSFELIQLRNTAQVNFDRVLEFTSGSPYDDIHISSDEYSIITNPTRKNSRDKLYESKLYASEFSLNKFVYDSFVFDFRLELINIEDMMNNWNGVFNIRYVVSQNLSSKFMFQFNDYVYMKYELQNYNNVLVIERDNEKALFTNAYINYLRMGYNFDLKQNERNNASNWASVGLTTIASIVSFASSSFTGGMGIASGIGLATTTAGLLSRAIVTTMNNDENIQQKLLQNQLQSSSVTGSNDVDIMKAYSGNKAKLVKYDMSEHTKEAVYNLLYYCGYSCNIRYSEINNFHTRCNFNFIQGNLVISKCNFSKEIEDEIVNKWKEGFTIIWEDGTSYNLPTSLYENWEIYLLED